MSNHPDARARRQKKTDPTETLPPHSIEAEQQVLGCCLLDPGAALAEVNSRVGPRTIFYDLRHQTIYGAMLALLVAGSAVDEVLLAERLKQAGRLAEVGDVTYLLHLRDQAGSAANLKHYLDIVVRRAEQREKIRVLVNAEARVTQCPDEQWDEVRDAIDAEVIAAGRVDVGGAATVQDACKEAIEEIHNCFKRGVGVIAGVRTRLGYLDKVMGGLHNGELIVVGARPSCGKTALGCTIAEHVALDEKLPVHFFSMEMRKSTLAQRMMSARAKANLQQLRTGFATEGDMLKLTEIAGQFKGAPLIIDDTPRLHIAQLAARARSEKLKRGTRLVVVDYLGLLRADGRDRYEQVTAISAGLQALARELNIPVLVLAQLNRESAKEKFRLPEMHDFRDSGGIEQDADAVILMSRRRSEDEDENEYAKDVWPILCQVAKQRNGPTDKPVELTFLRWCTRMEDSYGNTGSAALVEKRVEKKRSETYNRDDEETPL